MRAPFPFEASRSSSASTTPTRLIDGVRRRIREAAEGGLDAVVVLFHLVGAPDQVVDRDDGARSRLRHFVVCGID